MISRRDILRAMALGGGIVAGELWVPGARVISIPSDDVLSRFRWVDPRGVFGYQEQLMEGMQRTLRDRWIYFMTQAHIQGKSFIRTQKIENGRVLVEEYVPLEEMYACPSLDVDS